MIRNKILEMVEEYTYLGQTISTNPNQEIEIKSRNAIECFLVSLILFSVAVDHFR